MYKVHSCFHRQQVVTCLSPMFALQAACLSYLPARRLTCSLTGCCLTESVTLVVALSLTVFLVYTSSLFLSSSDSILLSLYLSSICLYHIVYRLDIYSPFPTTLKKCCTALKVWCFVCLILT